MSLSHNYSVAHGVLYGGTARPLSRSQIDEADLAAAAITAIGATIFEHDGANILMATLLVNGMSS